MKTILVLRHVILGLSIIFARNAKNLVTYSRSASLPTKNNYSDLLTKCLSGPQIEKLRPYTRLELVKRAENRSGNVPGVRLRENVVEKNGWQYTYKTWEASWTPAQGGKRVKRQFSVNKYGEEQAYKLAVKARRQALRDLEKNSA